MGLGVRMLCHQRYRKIGFDEGDGQRDEGDSHEQELAAGGRVGDTHQHGVVPLRADQRDDSLYRGQHKCQRDGVVPDLGDHFSAPPFHWPDLRSASATSGGM